MAKTKLDFVPSNPLRKERKIMVRFPRRSLKKVRQLMTKYEVKSMQALFDSLVIGGLVFRRAEIIEFIRKHRPEYERIHKLHNLAKIGKAEKPEVLDMYGINMAMYNADHVAFKGYIVEENIKQQWVWSILFEDGFAAEEAVIVDLVKRHVKLNISSRKKAIARLSNDEYIRVLPEHDAAQILDQMTLEYDNRQFDDSLAGVIEAKLNLKQKEEEQQEEDILEKDLNDKIRNLRMSRSRRVKDISKPKLDLE